MSIQFSGKTRAYLAKAEREAKKDEPIMVIDAETGEACALNTVPAVSSSSVGGSSHLHPLNDHRSAHRGPTLAEENMPNITTEQQRDKAIVLRLLKHYQQTQLTTLITKEAQREVLRREILAKEESKWRRELMKKAFIEERLLAADEIKKMKLDQEVWLAKKLKEYGMLK